MCAVKRTGSLTGQLSEALGLLRGRLEGPLLQAVKTAVASGFSWFVAANLLGNQIPVFAPLAAVLTVQVTIWQSVSRGLQRVAGVVVGVLVASAFAHVAGIHAWSIAVVIFVSLLLGRAMRLGTQGSIQVPISALLVLVLGATTGGYGLDRVVDTAIGAACGILVNLAVFPRIHLSEANARVRSLAEGLGSLVRGVAAWVERAEAAPPTPPEDPDALLGAARLLSDRVTAAAGPSATRRNPGAGIPRDRSGHPTRRAPQRRSGRPLRVRSRGPPRLRAQPPCGGCRRGHRGGRASHPRGAERDADVPAGDARLAIPLRSSDPLTAGTLTARGLHLELSRYIVGISPPLSPEATSP
jgi:hypothetical protein